MCGLSRHNVFRGVRTITTLGIVVLLLQSLAIGQTVISDQGSGNRGETIPTPNPRSADPWQTVPEPPPIYSSAPGALDSWSQPPAPIIEPEQQQQPPQLHGNYFAGSSCDGYGAPAAGYGLAGNGCNNGGCGSCNCGDWACHSGPCRNSYSLGNVLQLSTCFSTEMLDFQNRQTDKQLLLLEHGCSVGNCGPRLVFGAQMRGSFIAASTNSPSQFPYLGRFPTSFQGNSATDARLLHGNLAFAGHVSPWVHGYFETLFSDVFTFPTFTQGSFQVRQAYITVGNFNVSPFYLFIGKKTVGFGDMGTLSPFSQAINWHYFAALHEGIGVGYYCNGININATALNGGRGIRVADSEEIGVLNNFAVNASMKKNLGRGVCATIGGGYLHGTIYDAQTAEHINTGLFGPRNAAWDVNGQLQVGCVRLAAEYTSTFDAWPVTNIEVSAFRTEAAINTTIMGRPGTLSISYSDGNQGHNGAQWEFNRQLVVGAGIRYSPNVLFTAEWVQSDGFAPLINITTASNRNVQQNSGVLGLVITL